MICPYCEDTYKEKKGHFCWHHSENDCDCKKCSRLLKEAVEREQRAATAAWKSLPKWFRELK